MYIFYISCLIILIISTYTDLKERKISNKLMIFSFILGIILNLTISKTYLYIVLSVLLYALFLILPIKIGGGDIKLLSIIILYLREYSSLFFIIIGIVCLLYDIFYIKRKNIKDAALAPAILVSYIMNILLIYAF